MNAKFPFKNEKFSQKVMGRFKNASRNFNIDMSILARNHFPLLFLLSRHRFLDIIVCYVCVVCVCGMVVCVSFVLCALYCV